MVTVFVPALDSHLRQTIAPQSAIVGTPVEGNPTRLLIDYEGNIH